MSRDFTIEPDTTYGDYSLYEWGIYEDNSVLAGQSRKTFIKTYPTVEDALKDYPNAPVGYRNPNNTFNHLPDQSMSAREEESFFQGEDY